MGSAAPPAALLRLLLVCALPAARGDRPGADPRARPGTGGAAGGRGPARPAPDAPSPPPPPPEHRRERAPAAELPLAALCTAAAVAFVLFKCWQVRAGRGEAPVLRFPARVCVGGAGDGVCPARALCAK